jgi:CRP/FNR family transcriptional regulator, cyclic AMP receptor protein
VVKGRFAIRVMTPLGEQATIAVRGPGDSFGEMALVGGEAARRPATVEAPEEGRDVLSVRG